MSFLNKNKFAVALGGGTLIGAAALYFLGSSGASRYEEAKVRFEEASTQALGFEKLALYPKSENRDGKKKALDEYRKSLESIQSAFQTFRPTEIKDISPQDFTNRLKAADVEIRKAFEDSGTKVPDAFFVGFEGYKTSLARANSTGILDYQLGAVKKVLLSLANASPSELKNLHRPTLPEEEGTAYVPAANAVARPLPLELTFVGPEKSARDFLSSIVKPTDQYVVVRAIRVANAKKDPPRASDAQFEKPANAKGAAAADAFAGGFVLPGEEPAATTPVESAQAKAPAADSSRILSQVLGNEEIVVFVRLDVLQFLPAKKLP